jgi:hypothetical protein
MFEMAVLLNNAIVENVDSEADVNYAAETYALGKPEANGKDSPADADASAANPESSSPEAPSATAVEELNERLKVQIAETARLRDVCVEFETTVRKLSQDLEQRTLDMQKAQAEREALLAAISRPPSTEAAAGQSIENYLAAYESLKSTPLPQGVDSRQSFDELFKTWRTQVEQSRAQLAQHEEVKDLFTLSRALRSLR